MSKKVYNVFKILYICRSVSFKTRFSRWRPRRRPADSLIKTTENKLFLEFLKPYKNFLLKKMEGGDMSMCV